MSYDIVFHSLATVAYLLLSLLIWRPLLAGRESTGSGAGSRGLLALVLVLHGVAVHLSMLHEDSLRLTWSVGLSLTIWLGMIVFWLENLVSDIDGLQLLLLPIAGLICLLAALFPGHDSISIPVHDSYFQVHLLISIAAYSLIAIAAIHAFLMTMLDRYLHQPVQIRAERTLFARALEAQPPLLVQEKILFRLIWIGFSLLTLSILTGAVVSLKVYGVLLPFDHKTVFTLMSWVVFGLLLLGRAMRGWRGRFALRWTLIGFGLLMLAYTGTRFIFDVLLQKGGA